MSKDGGTFYNPLADPVDNEPVTTICNNMKVNWNTREDARRYFFKKYHSTSVSEREPYGNVLIWILLGKKICTDRG